MMDTMIDRMMDKIKKFLPESLGRRATQLYIFPMLLIFPLFFTDGMFHLFLDKRNFFLFFSIAYICVLFPAAMVALYDWGNDMYVPKRLDSIFALVLLSAFLISTIFSINARMTFYEMTSRTVSGLCYLFGLLTFFAIRQYVKVDKLLWWTWLAGSSVLYLFGILCACGINVMHIQDGLDSTQLPTYLTPLSNTNYNTCYVCLMLPPAMAMYMLCKTRFSRILCGFSLYLGFLFTLFIKTDSSIIAVILGMLLLGYFALEREAWSMQYLRMTGIYLGAKLTIHILLALFPQKLYPFYGLNQMLLGSKLLLCEILCYVAFFLLWGRKQDILREKLASARKYMVIFAAVTVCCCIGCVIVVNLNAANIPKDSFWRCFVLTDATFSGRGYIWIRTVSVWKEEPIGRKLFGNGLNSFRTLMNLTRTVPAGDTFADPHNEFLQMAIDMGVLGLIGYFGLLFSTLIRGLQNWRENPFYIMTVLTLNVYMIQALANEYSIYILPLLFIFLGVANGRWSDITPPMLQK